MIEAGHLIASGRSVMMRNSLWSLVVSVTEVRIAAASITAELPCRAVSWWVSLAMAGANQTCGPHQPCNPLASVPLSLCPNLGMNRGAP